MDHSVSVNFEEMCRSCMDSNMENRTELTILHSIFDFVDCSTDSVAQRIQIIQLLESVVHQLPKIQILDKLPKKICSVCLEKLVDSYKFQNNCIASHERLLALLENGNNKLTNEHQTTLIKEEIDSETEENFQVEEVLTIDALDKELRVVLKQENDDDIADLCVTKSVDDNEENSITDDHQKSKVIWRCKNCLKEFFYKYSLIKHLKDNGDNKNNCKKRINCFFCDATFTCKLYLQKHMKSVHNIDTSESIPTITEHKCDKCQLTFVSEDSFEKHLCTGNSTNFKSVTTASLHFQNKDVKPMSSDSLILNFKKEINSLSVPIKEESQIESYETNLQAVNKRNKKVDEVLIEKLIEETYLFNKNDTKHESEDKKSIMCDICFKIFRQRKNLIYHLLAKHGIDLRGKEHQKPINLNDRETWKCNVCGEIFEEFSTFVIHKAVHTEKRRYKCKYCNKNYFAADRLRLHMRIHTGNKPYACKYCPRRYNRRNGLNVHLRKHLGDNV